jgi:hypothetical protein
MVQGAFTASHFPMNTTDLPAAEAELGKALALIHRVLHRLDEPARSAEVQAALRNAAACLDSARQAHARALGTGQAASPQTQRVATGIHPEIAAAIAAAVSQVLDRPYRLVSVQKVTAPVPHLNVWALEGRTQIFQSRKVR